MFCRLFWLVCYNLRGDNIKHKNNVLCLFDKKSVEYLNSQDLYRTINEDFYVLEIEGLNIFVAENELNTPAYFTPFYSLAIKFKTYDAAEEFLFKTNNSMPWSLKIKKVVKAWCYSISK